MLVCYNQYSSFDFKKHLVPRDVGGMLGNSDDYMSEQTCDIRWNTLYHAICAPVHCHTIVMIHSAEVHYAV